MSILLTNEQLQYDPEKKRYHAKAICFSPAAHGVRVTFSGSSGCNLLILTLDEEDGHCPAVVTCIRQFGNGDTAVCGIEEISGVHDVYFKPEGNLQITSVEFTEENPYDTYPYEPVPEEILIDTESEMWEAVDMLGRKVKSAEDVRGKRKDRRVGIFYWSWHDASSHLEPINITKTLEQYPGAEYNRNHPVWGDRQIQSYWSEPLYGYYLDRDPYIIRHHAVLLANAGIDMIMFDCTNGTQVWKNSYEPIFEGFRQARLDGIRTPQIAFMLNLGHNPATANMLRGLYQDLYKPGRYRDLWFMHEGKPFIMAYEELLPTEGYGEFDTALLREIHEFFTFRAGQPSYGYGPTRPDFWGWLEKAPQHKFCEREDGSCEMMTVGVAQNCNDELICTYFNNKKTYGRSYTHEYGHALLDSDSYKYGYNFQEQWDRAIDCDPDFIFVTGWNEWIMGQWHDAWVRDPDNPQIAFVDQFDREHSRDIEPDRDGIKDTYYLQLVSNIRRYKGAPSRQKPSEPVTITDFKQWESVYPIYKNSKGTTIHRDCKGFGSTYYTNTTGRNDIIAAKAARDSEYVYFYAETANPLTPPTDPAWMTLFIDTDCNPQTGWEGYDIVVNRRETGVVERFTAVGWQCLADKAEIQYEGNQLMLKLPRTLFGDGNKKLHFTFKWSDNMQAEDIMDFYENGCAAPVGRFQYLFME